MSTARQSQALPPDNEAADLARASAGELSRLLTENPDIDRAHVRLDGRDLILPRQALALLRDLLTDMAQGNAVTIMPTYAELTTQEAANILNVSRPYLIKLLEGGKLAFTKTGTHRRIRCQDVMTYKEQCDKKSREALDELSRHAQEHHMGY